MKFVHIADMHFDTPFTNLNTKGDFGKIRRLEQREIFRKIINFIKENNINYFFIAGDLYEHTYIRKSTIEYINSLFKQIPETKIFISPGNHDPFLKNSMYNNFKWNENVKIFNSKLQIIENNNIDIYGIGFNDFYSDSLNIEKIQLKNKEKINILITHGSLNSSDKLELNYNPINKKNLEKIGFDYVALGHIHKLDYNSEENQTIVYPGSTMAMGFDELGKHGFIYGEIEKNKIDISFIPIDNREFVEKELNISDTNSVDEIIEKINNLNLENNNLYKIILVGNRKFEIDILEIHKYINSENILKINDNTKINYNLESLANENTLKGICVNEIINESNKYTKNELEKILEIILSVLE